MNIEVPARKSGSGTLPHALVRFVRYYLSMPHLHDESRSSADVRAAAPRRAARVLEELPQPRGGSEGVERRWVARAAAGFVAAAIVVAGIFILGAAQGLRGLVVQSVSGIGEGAQNLEAFDTVAAREHFARARDVAGASSESPFRAIELFLGGMPEMLHGVSLLAELGITVADDMEYVRVHALDALLGDGGEEFMGRLERVAQSLREARAQTRSLTAKADTVGIAAPFSDLITPFGFDADSASRFLDAGLGWFKAPGGRRIAVLFQNPLEMRPAGGFLGSFAEIEVYHGVIVSSTIRDVVEADRRFAPDIIPPRPLQGIMRRWKAADANWFFDFPVSAAHVAEFLEGSELYRRTSSTFDGVIALSPRVLTDVFSRTGPVAVPGMGTLDAENFLASLQNDVRTREVRGDASPKKALQSLAQVLRDRLRTLDMEARRDIVEFFPSWIARRDLMFFVRDSALQRLLREQGVGGAVASFPEDFEGDYLAVVDANVGGGKTDGVIKSRVTWESQIGREGIVTNHLTLTRTHEGDAHPYAWERLLNDDYLQILTPERSQLANFSGGEKISVPARPEYARNFVSDPSLAEIELGTEESAAFPQVATHLESGKKVFATRIRTPVGEERKIILDYSHRLFVSPRDGTAYRFVFERQAGSMREYHFTISAPVGFRFRENHLPVWNLVTSDPPGRLVVDLTLEQLKEN